MVVGLHPVANHHYFSFLGDESSPLPKPKLSSWILGVLEKQRSSQPLQVRERIAINLAIIDLARILSRFPILEPVLRYTSRWCLDVG